LPKGEHRPVSERRQTLGEPDRRGRLALTQRRGCHRSDDDVFRGRLIGQGGCCGGSDLGDVSAVGLQMFRCDAGRGGNLLPIEEVAASAGITAEHLEPYGAYIAKVAPTATAALSDQAPAKYIVITAVTPTPLGEGKTTTSIGLAQGLAALGHRTMLSLRQ